MEFFTRDGQILYPRTIRQGENLGAFDVATKRENINYPPSEGWMIYIEDGLAKAANTYDLENPAGNWRYQYTIGPAVDVACEYDGYFERTGAEFKQLYPDDHSRFVFRTVGDPWFFRITPQGYLVGQQGVGANMLTLAGPGVTKVSVVRGWRAVTEANQAQDQGLIVAYIRNGRVYYRNLAEQIDGSVIWENERLVDTLPGPASSVHVFRATDYRSGFLAEVNGAMLLSISNIDWAGMALDAEHLSATIADISITVTQVNYRDSYIPAEHLSASITDILVAALWVGQLAIVQLSNPDAMAILVEFDHGAANAAGQEAAWSVKDEHDTLWPVLATAAGMNERQIILSMADFNNARGDLTVSYDHTLGTLQNEAGIPIGSIIGVFTPQGLVPTIQPVPVVVSLSNPDGTGTALQVEFDEELTADPAGSVFNVSFEEWNGATLQPRVVAPDSVQIAPAAADQRVVQLNFSGENRFNNAVGVVGVEYVSGTLQGSGGLVEPFVEQFGPVGLLPTMGGVAEHLTASIVNIQIDVNQVTYLSAESPAHHLEATIADLTIDVIQVGHNPL